MYYLHNMTREACDKLGPRYKTHAYNEFKLRYLVNLLSEIKQLCREHPKAPKPMQRTPKLGKIEH